ncbi:cysteine-rich KTR domain-containing protein [Lachnospiraceae bacterium ZAX-1]
MICPVCCNKTRIKIRQDTVIENLPLYCSKCKQETFMPTINDG